jgi:hypothetical protein
MHFTPPLDGNYPEALRTLPKSDFDDFDGGDVPF